MANHHDLSDAHQFLRGAEAAEALRIIGELNSRGFSAYLAGGCVRDALLGRQPKDYDVATDATPDAIREVFGKKRTLAFGASFGVIGVLPNSSSRETVAPTEVATFRSDGFYSDGRRPDSVHFGDAEHDAQRRDFTINGLFYDPLADRVIDYVDGVNDLRRGVLRTIGHAVDRFSEDKLRMLRAVRFATTLAMEVDPATHEAIVHHAADIRVVSGERIGAEMRRVLVSPHAVAGLRRLQSCGLDRYVLPELESIDDRLLENMYAQWQRVDFPLALASFVSTIESASAVPENMVDRWKLSNIEVRMANAAVCHWRDIAAANQRKWSEVQPVLLNRDIDTIVRLAEARIEVQGLDRRGLELSRSALTWPADRLDPPPLLNGDDLRQLGIPAGPDLGKLLRHIRNAQLNGELADRGEAEKLLEKLQS